MQILITNLSEQVMVRDLIQMFSAFGPVSFATINRDKKTGRSQGTAVLEMPQDSQAEQAILCLHEKIVDGRQMAVQKIEYRAGEFNN